MVRRGWGLGDDILQKKYKFTKVANYEDPNSAVFN